MSSRWPRDRQPDRRGRLPVPGGEGRLPALDRPARRGQGSRPRYRRRARRRCAARARRARSARQEEFFAREVGPHLGGEAVRYIGGVGEDKLELYAGARAFLMPIRWPEPFGLVMTEAMACGTPVIAFPEGSAPELVVDGETGFIVGRARDGRGRGPPGRDRPRSLPRAGTGAL